MGKLIRFSYFLTAFQVALSQDDLTVLLRILMENIGEASSVQSDTDRFRGSPQTRECACQSAYSDW